MHATCGTCPSCSITVPDGRTHVTDPRVARPGSACSIVQLGKYRWIPEAVHVAPDQARLCTCSTHSRMCATHSDCPDFLELQNCAACRAYSRQSGTQAACGPVSVMCSASPRPAGVCTMCGVILTVGSACDAVWPESVSCAGWCPIHQVWDSCYTPLARLLCMQRPFQPLQDLLCGSQTGWSRCWIQYVGEKEKGKRAGPACRPAPCHSSGLQGQISLTHLNYRIT